MVSIIIESPACGSHCKNPVLSKRGAGAAAVGPGIAALSTQALIKQPIVVVIRLNKVIYDTYHIYGVNGHICTCISQ